MDARFRVLCVVRDHPRVLREEGFHCTCMVQKCLTFLDDLPPGKESHFRATRVVVDHGAPLVSSKRGQIYWFLSGPVKQLSDKLGLSSA